jgi:hypothetical protein
VLVMMFDPVSDSLLAHLFCFFLQQHIDFLSTCDQTDSEGEDDHED